MASNDLLDYDEFEVPRMDWAAIPLSVRLMSIFLLLEWASKWLGVYLPSWTSVYGEYNTILNWVNFGLGFWVVFSFFKIKKPPIPIYIAAFVIGFILSVFCWLFTSIFDWEGIVMLMSQMSNFLMYNSIFLIIIYAWRRREGAGIWWSLWEKWGYIMAISYGIISLIYGVGYSIFDMDYSVVRIATKSIRLFLLIGGSTYFFWAEMTKYKTSKERLIARLSWVAFMAHNVAMYLDAILFKKILLGIAIVLLVFIFYQVLEVADPKGQRWSKAEGEGSLKSLE